jgi:hypothetical protein
MDLKTISLREERNSPNSNSSAIILGQCLIFVAEKINSFSNILAKPEIVIFVLRSPVISKFCGTICLDVDRFESPIGGIVIYIRLSANVYWKFIQQSEIESIRTPRVIMFAVVYQIYTKYRIIIIHLTKEITVLK